MEYYHLGKSVSMIVSAAGTLLLGLFILYYMDFS